MNAKIKLIQVLIVNPWFNTKYVSKANIKIPIEKPKNLWGHIKPKKAF